MTPDRFEPQRPQAMRDESGYVLIAAVWLLLLGASIVALLMAKNLGRGEALFHQREQLQMSYVQESTVESVIADMLFNGPRSQFAQLPAEASYTIAGKEVRVSVSSESGKIDLNQADPALIERALRGLNVPAVSRQNLLSAVQRNRAAGHNFETMADVESIITEGPAAETALCWNEFFTVYSGLAMPQSSQIKPELTKALGQPSLSGSGKVTPGSALQIIVRPENDRPLLAIVRVSGLIGKSHSVLDWTATDSC